MQFPITRMRRLRKNSKIRDIVRETKLQKEDLIYPIYFKDDLKGDEKEEISSLPGEFRYSLESGVEFAKKLEAKGLKSIIVFGIPPEEEKDEIATPDYADTLCQYTSHGHCGLIAENDDTDDGIEILNDESLEYIAKVALSHARAGADIVAPSDMMDGRVGAIRQALDENGYYNVMIMSYSAKYASAFYEPFRQAACSSPHKGDRKSYQMDPANAVEAIRECELDVIEGCDFLMVKPALPYLDVVRSVRDEFMLPLVAYNVSGEYSMIMAAIEKGYLTERAIMESLVSIKRAGADLIITNFAPKVLLEDMIE